ncbi:hypothetical protein [Limnohabitans sp. T6-5]|uniref:hypothetical protein n=1 Tax=Limnohabitans sp. T6-5 TaxID=1100724 RepID=UPI0011B29F03|nr:hypothetical protein [Limnohabitans sp. T6-5]
MKPKSPELMPAWTAIASFVAFLCALCGAQAQAQAQEGVYRCGQEYTNAPRDKSRCQLLNPQAVTVIEGTRPTLGGATAATADDRTKMEPSKAEGAAQKDRDAQGRTIVATELEKTRQQHAQLLQEYKQGESVQWKSETREQAQQQERMAKLKAAIERAERDMESLQRELARRPAPTHP